MANIKISKRKNIILSGDKHSLLELIHTIIETITDDKETELKLSDNKLIVKIEEE